MPPSEPDISETYRKADRIAYLIIFIIITALFIPIWSRGLTTLLPSYQDETQWILYRTFINQSLSSGHFPLWCPHLFAGMNFAGWGHGSAFYPPGIIFYIWKYAAAVPINQWFHLLLGTLGLYYLGRVIRIRPLAACLAALWFGLGHLVPSFQENFLPRVFVLGWCPWIYALLYQLIHTRRMKFLVLSAVFMAMQWLSGHIEMAVLQYEVIGLGFLALLATRFRRNPAVVLIFSGAVILAVPLAMLQFLPALEETNWSFRSLGFDYDLFQAFTMPNFWFEAWFFWLSIGNLFTILALVYALCAIKKNRRVLFISCLIFFILAMNFNWFNILSVIYHIPLINRFIPHGRMLPQVFMLMALMIGIGIDQIRNVYAEQRTAIILPLVIIVETAAVIILLHVLHLQDRVQTDPAVQDALMNFFKARLSAGYALGVLALIMLALALMRRGPRLGGIMLSLIFALEFIPAAFAHIPKRPQNILDYNPEYIRFFEGQKELARSLIVYPFDSYHELDIPLQSGVLYGTHGADAYITLSTMRYTRFMSLLDSRAYRLEKDGIADIQTPNILKRGDFMEPETIPFMNLINLKYIVSQNKNIKAATHYFLAYEMNRFSPVKGKVKKSGRKNIEIIPPARFGLNIYFHQGDRLRFGIKVPQGIVPGPVLIEVAGLSRRNTENVIFEKTIALAPGRAYMDFDIPLSDIWEKRASLCVSIRALEKDRPGRVILTRPHIYNPSKHFTRLDSRDIDIYINPTAMRRAFLVHDFRVIPEADRRIEFMGGEEFKPDEIAVLESDPVLEIPGDKGSGRMLPGEAVKINKYEPDEVHVMVRSIQPGLLLLSDQYEPGWRVWVGGEEKQIMPADEAFRAVKLDAGHHLVQFKYRPKSFAISLYFSIASWLVFLVLITVRRLGAFRAINRSP